MSQRLAAVVAATTHSLEASVPEGITAVGVDAVDIEDFEADLRSDDPATFLASVFVEAELVDCAGRSDRLAARFAVKEATLKALGTGVQGIGMTDVEVRTADNGQPSIELSPPAARIAASSGIQSFLLSITREAGLAIAVVVGTTTLGTNAKGNEHG